MPERRVCELVTVRLFEDDGEMRVNDFDAVQLSAWIAQGYVVHWSNSVRLSNGNPVLIFTLVRDDATVEELPGNDDS